MSTKAKKIVKVTVDVFLWIFLAVALLMTVFAFSAQASSNGMPRFGNTVFLTVQSESMKGPNGFNAGDLIIGRVLTDEEKQNLTPMDENGNGGDVITFWFDRDPWDGQDFKELNTHRIIDTDIDSYGNVKYITKGDNNDTVDTTLVKTEDIEAIWTGKTVPGFGRVIDFLQSKTGFLVCIVLPLLLFFLYELYQLISIILQMKNKGKKQITAAEEEMIKQRAIEEYIRQQAEKKAEDEQNR